MRNYWILTSKWIICSYILASLWACKETTKSTELFSIMVDVTDSHIAKPNASELLAVMQLDKTDKQVKIRYTTLSDVDYNKVEILNYTPHGKGLLGNAVMTKRKRVRFEKKLAHILSKNDSVVVADYSTIFQPIIRELRYMSKQVADKKQVFVFSNLMENSDLASFYATRDYLKLLKNQQSLVKRFLATVPKFDTQGLHLHIIYIPHSQKDNVQFKALEKLYCELFKNLDIPITFSANVYNAYPSP